MKAPGEPELMLVKVACFQGPPRYSWQINSGVLLVIMLYLYVSVIKSLVRKK